MKIKFYAEQDNESNLITFSENKQDFTEVKLRSADEFFTRKFNSYIKKLNEKFLNKISNNGSCILVKNELVPQIISDLELKFLIQDYVRS